MSRIYLDQNALISLGRKARQSDCREKLNLFIAESTGVFVLSLWHLVETSYGSNPANSGELADFIESLSPAWLLERHEILKLDVSEDLYRHLRLDHNPPNRVVARSDMFAALDRYTGGGTFRGTLREFVALWRRHRDEAPYAECGEATTRLRQAQQCGKLSAAKKLAAARNLIQSVLPRATPAGVEISPALAQSYLAEVDPYAIPSVALDIAISEYEWAPRTSPGRARNDLVDKFHLLSALPYVDFVVADDHFFHAAYQWAERTGHVRARLIHNEEFLRQFE